MLLIAAPEHHKLVKKNEFTTGKCSRIQSKYFYELLTGSLPEMLRDKCSFLSFPVFDWFSTANTGHRPAS